MNASAWVSSARLAVNRSLTFNELKALLKPPTAT